MYNEKEVACGAKPTENYLLTLQFLSTLRSVIASVTNCFGFMARNFTSSLSQLSSTSFPYIAGGCFQINFFLN